MTRRVLLFVFLLVAGCGAILSFVFLPAGCGPANSRTSTQPAQAQPDLDYPVGEFSFTERSGKTVTDKDLRGKVWIASFVFTRCNGPCPAVTSTMARLQKELKDELQSGKVKLVTFTVDPKRDDLKALNTYANNRQADPNNWLFLTGDEKTIHALLRDQFKQHVSTEPGAKEGAEFDHSTRLSLVDASGVIRATYEGLANEDQPDGKERFEAGLKLLKDRVRELAK